MPENANAKLSPTDRPEDVPEAHRDYDESGQKVPQRKAADPVEEGAVDFLNQGYIDNNIDINDWEYDNLIEKNKEKPYRKKMVREEDSNLNHDDLLFSISFARAIKDIPSSEQAVIREAALNFAVGAANDAKLSVSSGQLPPPIHDEYEKNAGKPYPLENSNIPSVAPALWKDRTSGREVSPADFIRENYKSWIGRGLTRAILGHLDEELYDAYSQWARRNPTKDFLPKQPHKRHSDPLKALERRREVDREAQERFRQKKKHNLN